MPCPIDLYHGPASFLMSMPMLFQRLISAICVPELSPREMKGAPLALMVCSAKATLLAPLMLAGSSFGKRVSIGPMLSSHVFMTELEGPMTAKAFHALFGRIGARAKMQFPIHPHRMRHACGNALANAGHDTRARQAWLGHRNIQHTVRYMLQEFLAGLS